MRRTFSLLFISFLVAQFVRAQNFTGGFNFNLPYDDSTTVDFLPHFPKKPIGPADFVSADSEGNFVVNGTPIRFFGGNLTTQGAFPGKSDAEKIAGRMRKMGINLIRFHHIDNPWSNGSLFYNVAGTRRFNALMLDRLDYLIYQLKENGIYVNMNLNVSRTFEKSDGVHAADSLKDYAKGITLFNRHMIDLQKEYAHDLLAHVNPYTGIPLAHDPVLAMVEIVNENSLYRRWYSGDLKPFSEGGTLPLKYALELDSMWHSFLSDKYDSTQYIAEAWNKSRKKGDTIYFDDFEKGLDKNKWQLEQHENAQASYQLHTDAATGNKSLLAKAIVHGSQSWHITLKTVGHSMKKDSVYELHFKAKADGKKNISAGFQMNKSPYTGYMNANFQTDTMYQSYKVVFKASENNTGYLRMNFRFDGNTGDFNIDDVLFKTASTIGLQEEESLDAQNIKRLELHELNGFAEQRVVDLSEFYAGIQIRFLNEMRSFLKDSLGVKVPLAGTNWYTGPEDVYVQNTLDYLDNHAYWDHPGFPNQPWSQTDWFINNQPMMLSSSATIERLFNGLNVKGKPYTISEYNHGYPNQFQAEMLPMITSYLSFNGADGIMFFTYSGSWDWDTDFNNSYFDLHRNNAVMAGFPIFAHVFRKQLISEAKNSVVVNYQKADVLKMPLDAENGWGTHSPFPRELSYTNKVELTFNENEPTDLSQVPAATGNPFSLNQGEVFWNNNGIFKINTPKFASISGELHKNTGTKTDQMELQSASDFGTIAWLSLVDSSLQDASKSVLFVGTKQINSSMIWDGTTSVHNNWGKSPTWIGPLTFSLKMKNNSAGLKVIPLTRRGVPDTTKTSYFVTHEDGYSLVHLNIAEDRTLWYGIETVADWSTTKISNVEFYEMNVVCYPNPSTERVTIENQLGKAVPFQLSVYDTSGKLVFTGSDKYSYQLSKNDIGTGLFLYKTFAGEKQHTGKFVMK